MRIVALHLLPGACIGAAYFAAAPLLVRAGFPRVFALLVAFLVIGIPMQLAIARRLGVRYRERLPWWQYVLGTLTLIGVIALLMRFAPLGPIAQFLRANVFAWVPAEGEIAGRYILATLVLQLLVDGIANPIVEEIYFRGMLLPRLEHLGIAAPLANTALFALAHVWQPQNAVTIFVMVLPLTLFTWSRRNFYVQTFIHCLANTIGALLAFG